MSLSKNKVEKKASEYREDVSHYPEEKERLKTLPTAFKDGSYTIDDLEWVVRWKSPRPIRQFQKNNPEEVRAAIGRVVREDNPRKKMDGLTTLNGIAERMASAFLIFMEPEQYTVLDWRTWGVLYESGHLYHESRRSPTIDDYLTYLGACRALATEFDVSLRKLDRALWVIGEGL